MISRLADHLRSVNQKGQKALGVFVTSGFPTPEDSLPILQAIERGGADFLELGMPFSDPLAEGLPIQHSSSVALQNGVTMQKTLSIAAAFRNQSTLPLVLMGYANPVIRYGISNFFRDARSSGVDGVILPDVLPETDPSFSDASREHGVDLIHLVAPTTSESRVKQIDQASSGFVYAVSVTGITGAELGSKTGIMAYLERTASLVTKNPLLVGFGIQTHADATLMAKHTHGVIVGSALVKVIDTLFEDSTKSRQEKLDGISAFVRELKYGPVHD